MIFVKNIKILGEFEKKFFFKLKNIKILDEFEIKIFYKKNHILFKCDFYL